MSREKTKLVVGRGEIYFEQFLPGTTTGQGELYIGNTPSADLTREITYRDIYNVRNGVRVLDMRVPTEETNNGRFTTDNISKEIIALFYSGGTEPISQPGAEAVEETIQVWRGRWFQIGRSAARPFGAAHLDFVSATLDGDPVPAADYTFERETGRIYINPNATLIENGDSIVVHYSARSALVLVTEPGYVALTGALRYVSRNPVGDKLNYFWPDVTLFPQGGKVLKGDTWQEIGFEFYANSRDPNVAQVYAYNNGGAGLTPGEEAIIGSGITVEEFPYWEDQIDTIINVYMAEAGYPT